MAVIGIDLGTTNSLACVYRDGKAELIPNSKGSFMTPSVVALKDNLIVVGEDAKRIEVTNPADAVTLFKRKMGDKKPIKVGNRQFLPEELSSFIIKSLINDARAFLSEDVDEVVVSVPAYFYDAQRKATKKAAALAGVKCERIINEPSAAALSTYVSESKEETLLIFDFGGGTLDVSLVECIGNVVNIISIAGDNYLGGSDFDRIILEDVLNENNINPDSLGASEYQKMLLICEEAKKRLSSESECTINVDINNFNISSIYSRKRLADSSKEILSKIKSIVDKVIADALLSYDDIDRIVMVGGSSKMALIQSYIKFLFKTSPVVKSNCDETVAYGVGLFCGIKQRVPEIKQYILSDICPFSLGTGTANRINSKDGYQYNSIIIPRNTSLPCSIEQIYTTAYNYQSKITFQILQGDKPYAYQNICLDEIIIDVPKKKAGQEKIKVRYTYDINGILIVDVVVISTGNTIRRILADDIDDKQLEESIKELNTLMIHPREKEENIIIIEKLSNIIAEVPEDVRDYYLNLLKLFEEAIERQEILRIEKTRNKIESILDRNVNDFNSTDQFIETMQDEDEEYEEWEIFDKWIN